MLNHLATDTFKEVVRHKYPYVTVCYAAPMVSFVARLHVSYMRNPAVVSILHSHCSCSTVLFPHSHCSCSTVLFPHSHCSCSTVLFPHSHCSRSTVLFPHSHCSCSTVLFPHSHWSCSTVLLARVMAAWLGLEARHNNSLW